MISDPPRLSRSTRMALVVALWLFLLLVLGLMARGFGLLTSWVGAQFHSCLLLVALALAFSMLAAAVHISLDTLAGRYPYPVEPDTPPAILPSQPGIAPSVDAAVNPLPQGAASGAAGVIVRRKPRWRAWADGLGVLAITAVLSIVLLEIGLRIFAPQQSVEMREALRRDIFAPDPVAGFRNRPGADVVLDSAEFSFRMVINGQGLREDHEIGPPAPGVTRILCIGDSYTFGYGVSGDEAFPHLLNGRGVEAINAGVPAYGPDDTAAWLHAYGWQLKPNIVLLGFYVGNDVTDAFYGPKKLTVDERGNIKPQQDPPDPPQAVGGWLARNSHAYVFLRGLLSSGPKPQERPTGLPIEATIYSKNEPPQVTEGWQKAFAALDRIKADVDAHGARLVVAVFPMPEQTSDRGWQRMIAHWGLDAEQLQQDRPQARLTEWGARAGVPTIDLLPGFRSAGDGPYYFTTTWHWNRAGNALAAEIVREELARWGLIPR